MQGRQGDPLVTPQQGEPVTWLPADVNDDAQSACGSRAELYNFDAIAYESVIVGLYSIITGKRCDPPRPYNRGGEQDASRAGFNFLRSPVRSEAFLPMSTTYDAWNFQNVRL